MRKCSEKNMYKIFEFVKQQTREKGYPPTIREICAAVGLSSTSTVHSYLKKLEEKNLISMESSKTRAISIIDDEFNTENIDMNQEPTDITNVPIVGRVAAGQPILAEENIEEYFPVPNDFISGANSFMLRVSGDSMIEAGILDRDYVLIRQQKTAINGDIVVAVIDGEATVKTYYKEKDHIRLQPENQYLEPIIVKDVNIVGKVAGVFRRL